MPAKILILLIVLFSFFTCSNKYRIAGKAGEIHLIQLDPTHSHAAAAQSEQLSCLDTTVYVYAPDKREVDPYFQQIKSFNTRKKNPTKWNEVSCFGNDYLEKMVSEQKGNVVVLAGNNRIKIDYIQKSIDAGMNVFSDKPMVINSAGFQQLKNAYQKAKEKGVLMFDMMTERYSLINKIQKSLMQDTLLFGKLLTGSAEHPAVMESSVHHFYRGGVGTRPAWYFDVLQQGEGIVDVTTHLIDLTFWKSFPDEIVDYLTDVKVFSAKHWPVKLTVRQFSQATSLPAIPSLLEKYVKDSILSVYANGSITYRVKGIYTTVKVEWRPETPPEGNDLRNAYAEGSRSTILIQQEYGQKRPMLLVMKGKTISREEFKIQLNLTNTRLQSLYPGISYSEDGDSAQFIIPSGLENAHDQTFRVFTGYLINRDMPRWEVPNTLAKYFITTTALEMAQEKE